LGMGRKNAYRHRQNKVLWIHFLCGLLLVTISNNWLKGCRRERKKRWSTCLQRVTIKNNRRYSCPYCERKSNKANRHKIQKETRGTGRAVGGWWWPWALIERKKLSEPESSGMYAVGFSEVL
jgi:hypothetical protein